MTQAKLSPFWDPSETRKSLTLISAELSLSRSVMAATSIGSVIRCPSSDILRRCIFFQQNCYNLSVAQNDLNWRIKCSQRQSSSWEEDNNFLLVIFYFSLSIGGVEGSEGKCHGRTSADRSYARARLPLRQDALVCYRNKTYSASEWASFQSTLWPRAVLFSLLSCAAALLTRASPHPSCVRH